MRLCAVTAASVLALVLCLNRARAATLPSCTHVEEYFRTHNISADGFSDHTDVGAVCGGPCCGKRREVEIRALVRRQLAARAAHTGRTIADLLLSTRNSLQGHLLELSQLSQNKTMLLFAQVYRGLAARAHTPITNLYEEVRSLLRPLKVDDFGAQPPRDLSDSSERFFREIFPLAYHNVLRLDNNRFSHEYEICLREAYRAVQPFGDVPKKVGVSLTRSLEAARALLQALTLGAQALSSSEEILSTASSEVCEEAVIRALGCSRCRAYDARPCHSYCMNVARGCIGARVHQLDAPWTEYVEGVERLVRNGNSKPDADATLRTLDSQISEAIMHALENHITLEKKVRQECGDPSTTKSDTASSLIIGSNVRRDAFRAPPPDAELLQFAASLAGSKRHFAGFAERLCDDPALAEPTNENCWNGETLGEYSKPLVGASMSEQRYNPEVTNGVTDEHLVAALADTLRHARQLIISHGWGGTPTAENFMQGDEAGEGGDGSGSGRDWSDDDAAYDAEGSGEGSGHRIGDTGIVKEDTPNVEKPVGSATSLWRPIGRYSLILLLPILSRSLT